MGWRGLDPRYNTVKKEFDEKIDLYENIINELSPCNKLLSDAQKGIKENQKNYNEGYKSDNKNDDNLKEFKGIIKDIRQPIGLCVEIIKDCNDKLRKLHYTYPAKGDYILFYNNGERERAEKECVKGTVEYFKG